MAADGTLTTAEMGALLTALKKAWYSGAKSVTFMDREVTYRTAKEMKDAIAELEEQLRPAAAPRRKSSVSTFGSGF